LELKICIIDIDQPSLQHSLKGCRKRRINISEDFNHLCISQYIASSAAIEWQYRLCKERKSREYTSILKEAFKRAVNIDLRILKLSQRFTFIRLIDVVSRSRRSCELFVLDFKVLYYKGLYYMPAKFPAVSVQPRMKIALRTSSRSFTVGDKKIYCHPRTKINFPARAT